MESTLAVEREDGTLAVFDAKSGKPGPALAFPAEAPQYPSIAGIPRALRPHAGRDAGTSTPKPPSTSSPSRTAASAAIPEPPRELRQQAAPPHRLGAGQLGLRRRARRRRAAGRREAPRNQGAPQQIRLPPDLRRLSLHARRVRPRGRDPRRGRRRPSQITPGGGSSAPCALSPDGHTLAVAWVIPPRYGTPARARSSATSRATRPRSGMKR